MVIRDGFGLFEIIRKTYSKNFSKKKALGKAQ
jgi:hypothetical protein